MVFEYSEKKKKEKLKIYSRLCFASCARKKQPPEVVNRNLQSSQENTYQSPFFNKVASGA